MCKDFMDDCAKCRALKKPEPKAPMALIIGWVTLLFLCVAGAKTLAQAEHQPMVRSAPSEAWMRELQTQRFRTPF